MGDPRPNFIDGVVAELVTGQVREHPELPAADHWHTEAIAVSAHLRALRRWLRADPATAGVAPAPSEPPHVFL